MLLADGGCIGLLQPGEACPCCREELWRSRARPTNRPGGASLAYTQSGGIDQTADGVHFSGEPKAEVSWISLGRVGYPTVTATRVPRSPGKRIQSDGFDQVGEGAARNPQHYSFMDLQGGTYSQNHGLHALYSSRKSTTSLKRKRRPCSRARSCASESSGTGAFKRFWRGATSWSS